MTPIFGSTACWPGLSHPAAIRALATSSEPLWGTISSRHVQLCPQNSGVLDAERLDQIQTEFSETQFRLHANVRVEPRLHRWNAAHADYAEAAPIFRRWAELSTALSAPAYTLHAGTLPELGPRGVRPLQKLWDNLHRLESIFQCPVGVEGLYPDAKGWNLLSSWDDYAELLTADVHFVIDLSHLQIVARAEQRQEPALVKALLSHSRCLEIHVSGNDGRHDQHQIPETAPWWHSILEAAASRAPVFTEGNQIRRNSPCHPFLN